MVFIIADLYLPTDKYEENDFPSDDILTPVDCRIGNYAVI